MNKTPVNSNAKDSAPLPDYDSLDAEIVRLASHINAATCRWLLLVHQIDEHPDRGGTGYRNTAHYLNHRCGISMSAARENVRVARAIGDLPLILEAFQQGQVSYSKVRAVTRVATAETDDYFLTLCEYGNASHIDKLVREYRQVRGQVGLDEKRPAVTRRTVRYHWDDDGMLVFSGRLPAEEGALVLKALDACERSLEPEHQSTIIEGGSVDGLIVAGDVPNPEGCGATQERAPDANAVGADSVSKEEPSLDHDGGEPLPAPTSAEANHSPDNTPAGVFFPAQWPPVPKPYDLSEAEDYVGAQRADALVRMAESFLATGLAALSGADRYQVVLHVCSDALHGDAPHIKRAIEHGPGLSRETTRRIACDTSTVTLIESSDGTPLDLGRKTRHISPSLQRALNARDGGCRFPGCTQRHHVDAHHIEHWADGGGTNLSNLVQICKFHHRLLHEGGFSIERGPFNAIHFIRPDGQHVPSAEPILVLEHPGALERQHDESSKRIDPKGCASKWDGQPMDHSMAIDGLLYRDLRKRL